MLERFQLDGRVAVVTGAGRGMGKACAAALAEAGATVVIAEIDPQTGPDAASDLLGRGFRVEALQLDVTNSRQVTEVAAALHERHGCIDVLVNNAGIGSNTPALDMGDDEWLRVVDVNLNGMFYCCRAFGRFMVDAGRGSIVNFGSDSGFTVDVPQPQAHYNASKAGVHMLTKSLAVEWAKTGVRVNAVAPGYVRTEMTLAGLQNAEWNRVWHERTPIGRLGEPDEVAALVLFLASDASSYMTGSIVLIDGGYTSV